MLARRRRIAPAASSCATAWHPPSPAALSRLIFEPARVARPSMSNRFLTANGTPASGRAPRRARGLRRPLGFGKAASAVTSVKAPSALLRGFDPAQGFLGRSRARCGALFFTAAAIACADPSRKLRRHAVNIGDGSSASSSAIESNFSACCAAISQMQRSSGRATPVAEGQGRETVPSASINAFGIKGFVNS